MGADNWENMSCWKDYEALVNEFPIIIYPRKGHDVTIPEKYTNIKKADAPLLEISSTFIRQAVKDNKDVRFFLPAKIWEMRDLFNNT
jgi:nicotinate-nucleotide adenylyltransferase